MDPEICEVVDYFRPVFVYRLSLFWSRTYGFSIISVIVEGIMNDFSNHF